MNSIAATRNELKTLIGQTGIAVMPHIPERIAPPIALLEPGDPFITEGKTFSEIEIRFNILLLASPVTNENATQELDQMIMDVIDQLDTVYIDVIDAPSAFEFNNAAYLGTRFSIIKHQEVTTL